MGLGEAIDITFDFRSDTPPGKDPDALSPTLRRYHQLLWSKPLPSGAPFELDVTTPGTYLHHRSELGEFGLSSDAVIPSFSRASELAHIIGQIPEVETEAFNRVGYTIGGMMVFPCYRVDRKMTINGARGFHPRIRDRFDLTLECIRRHYLDEPSPLSATLARYTDFFGLFGDFAGYVDFFHLPDRRIGCQFGWRSGTRLWVMRLTRRPSARIVYSSNASPSGSSRPPLACRSLVNAIRRPSGDQTGCVIAWPSSCPPPSRRRS